MIAQQYNDYNISKNILKSLFLVNYVSLNDLVSPHVQREMVTSRELSVTEITSERLVTGVLSIMSSQLVAASEFPLAIGPRA